MRVRAQDYQPDVRERLRMGAFISGAQYLRAQQLRALVRSEIDSALVKRDVLLAPATPIRRRRSASGRRLSATASPMCARR